MRKAILMMLLAVVSSNAAAEWSKVWSGIETPFTVYADLATIRTAGNRVKMWSLLDFKEAQMSAFGKPYLSSKAQREYDCKKEQSRFLYFSDHPENMGGGTPVYISSDPDNWSPVAPASVNARLWVIACRK